MDALLPEREIALGSNRSVMRELFEYGKQRAAVIGAENVFDYSIGNPSVPPPPCVNDCLRALLNGPQADAIHAYTSAQGDAACREKLAQSLNARFDAAARADDLYLTVGAAASLTITFHALCLPGDTAVMRNQNNGIARLVQAFNNPHDLSAGRGVKVSGWLVCQQQCRLIYQRSCKCNSLLFTT